MKIRNLFQVLVAGGAILAGVTTGCGDGGSSTTQQSSTPDGGTPGGGGTTGW